MSWAEEKTLEDYTFKLISSAVNRSEIQLRNSQLFTKDGTFVVPSGIFAVRISACASGKTVYAGEALLEKNFIVRPGEIIHFTCGLDMSSDDRSEWHKDTKIWSDSIGEIILYAGVLDISINTDILGFETGIKGGGTAGGQGGYFGYGGGAGGYQYANAYPGGVGAGPEGGAAGQSNVNNADGHDGGGISAGGGGYTIHSTSSNTYTTHKGGNSGNGYLGGEASIYNMSGGGAGGGYGAGGGGQASSYAKNATNYYGSPSGGMVFIEW